MGLAMLRNKISKRHYVMLILSIAWIVFICWCIWFQKVPAHNYLYECQIQNTLEDIFVVVFATVIPIGLVMAIIFFWRRGKYVLFMLAIPLSCFFVLVYTIVAALQGTLPDKCSYTTDIANFNCYDKNIKSVEGMPTQVPNNVEDVQYKYFYLIESGSSYYYISASWRFADADDFNAEMEKYEKMVTWGTDITEDTVIYDLARYGSSQAIFDIRNQTVFYVNASYNNYIPKTIEELKSWVPQKSEWVSDNAHIKPLYARAEKALREYNIQQTMLNKKEGTT